MLAFDSAVALLTSAKRDGPPASLARPSLSQGNMSLSISHPRAISDVWRSFTHPPVRNHLLSVPSTPSLPRRHLAAFRPGMLLEIGVFLSVVLWIPHAGEWNGISRGEKHVQFPRTDYSRSRSEASTRSPPYSPSCESFVITLARYWRFRHPHSRARRIGAPLSD